MNYLKLATCDFFGAGLASVKRIEDLRRRGLNAKLVVFEKRSDNDYVVGLFNRNKKPDKILIRIVNLFIVVYKKILISSANSKYDFHNVEINMISAKKILKLFGSTPDVIDVSWVSDFISAKTVNTLQKLTRAKILYVMTDNAPITGGCHYPWTCKGFTTNCYPCPALKYRSHLAKRTLSLRKKYILPNMILTGTTIDCNRAKMSTLFKDSIIVPSAQLRPNPYCFPRDTGRILWSINENRFVIFCGASFINEERKGFNKLVEAIYIMHNKSYDFSNITFLVAGTEQRLFPECIDVRMLGKLSEEELFIAYDCSDLFISPSLEDSGPMMVNYAFKSYLPVVCFPTGIALDLIKHKRNGYIADWGSSADMSEGIRYCVAHHSEIYNMIHNVNDHIEQLVKEKCSIDTYLGIS